MAWFSAEGNMPAAASRASLFGKGLVLQHWVGGAKAREQRQGWCAWVLQAVAEVPVAGLGSALQGRAAGQQGSRACQG